MRDNYQSPREYVGGCLGTVCSFINPCSLVCACFGVCKKSFRCAEILDRDILPDWCPRAADLKSPTEVTGLDHFDDDDRRAGGQEKRRWWAEFLKSCFFLLLGMFLTSIYGYLVLIHMSYNWIFSVTSTVSIGFFLCIGIPFFIRVRVAVFLMFPHFFSGYARAIILVIILSLAMNGPAANITENFQRVSNSSACGVQVVMNQTLEIMERVKEPLMRVLNFLKEMAGKVKNVAGKAKNFFQRIKARMKVIGKTLGHMWSFIHSIGNICNEELLNPYKKCAKIFTDAKEDCYEKGAGILCELVDTVSWICHVAKIAQVICIIPTYVGEYIQKNFKAPIMSVLQDLKNKFDYNMTINYDLGGTVNSSKSVFTIASDIMEEVKQDLDPYREVFHIFSYSVFMIAIFTYYTAVSYLRSYASDDNFDNIYITREFIRIDARRIKQGLTSLLPLSEKESYGLVRPMAFKLTRKERKGYTFEILNVFQSLLLVSFLIAADYFVYWCIAAISSVLSGDIIVKAPYSLRLNITGSGFINSVLAQLADALDAIGQKNYTVISKDCIPVASEPNYYVYLLIGGLYIFAFFSSAMGVYIHRLKRTICAWYFPQREQERLCFLFNNLLTKRMNLETSLKKNVRMNSADGHSNVLMVLAAQIPGFSCLTKLFGTTERYCMSCAKMTTPATSDQFVDCNTTGCKGLYCKNCFEILHNICVICMGPLAHKADIDEELQDGQLELWIEVMKQLKGKRTEKRKMRGALKNHLRHIVRRQGMETEIVQKYVAVRQQDSDGESSGFSEHGSSSESEVTDDEYQYRSETSDSDWEDWAAHEEYREPPDLIRRHTVAPGYRNRTGNLEMGYGPAAEEKGTVRITIPDTA